MNMPVSFKGANLPAVATLATALSNMAAEAASGDVILKMDKTGCWIYGADATEVEEGSKWAINPFSFIHGFIAWGNGTKQGEKMVPMTSALPDPGEAPACTDRNYRGWEQAMGFSLRCMDGEDVGLEAKFNVTSVGGKRSVATIANAIATQVVAEQAKGAKAAIVPLVRLETDHYQHQQYGKIFTPVFKIVGWVALEAEGEETPKGGDAPAAAAAAPAPEQPVADTGRRRRRAAS